ncbi:MAG: adenylate/guanylate cyclase domain-containing protein [Candidatus Binatia bacterium]|nr:adenylate/guanylate cyclase domain-containing protein [Candidatus Binatia bacterium]
MNTGDENQVLGLTVLFADICESMKLYAEQGDRAAFEIASNCLDLLFTATEDAGGRPVKRLGDGLLSTFATAPAAVEAASAMLGAVEAATWGHDPQIQVHIGIACGPVMVDAGDVHGDVVNVASRLASLAAADEVFLSREVHAELPHFMRALTRRMKQLSLRNRPGEVEVYQYLPVQVSGDATIASHTAWAHVEARLELTYDSQVISVGPDKPKVRLGRGADNDIGTGETQVSRYHAEISFQDGGFVLKDLSTNGTYVLADDGTPIARVFRSARTLSGAGGIALGRQEAKVIGFRVFGLA